MRRCTSFQALVMLFLPAAAFAQQAAQQITSPPVVTQDVQSLNAANAALGALGGAALVTTPRASITLLISGTYTDVEAPAPSSFPVRIKIFGLDQIRWEIDKPEGTYVTLVIGGAA